MEAQNNFIIDYDSTFIQVESLDFLANKAFSRAANAEELISTFKAITDRGMNGEISFEESINHRLNLLKADKSLIAETVEELKALVTPSFKRNAEFLKKNAENIYIVSNGFFELIAPVVGEYGIPESNIFANRFVFGPENRIIGMNKENPLSGNQGKVTVAKALTLEGFTYVIGDGYTDYEIRQAGLADRFYAFTANVSRKRVLEVADHEAPSLDEILYDLKIEGAVSYPKSRIKILLLENVHPNAAEALRKDGFHVETYPAAMDEDMLLEKIKGVSILGLRSKTKLTRKVVEAADRLIAVGAFCIGTNQIDLPACTEKGIAIFNAPFSNTRSVVELALGQIIMLMRNVHDASISMHQGKWSKTAKGCFEIRGKKLGIIGYGNIGSQLSILAEAAGMDVYYYDLGEKLPLGNVTKCETMEGLLSIADVVSLHVDGRPENKSFFGEREFKLMKNGSVFINLSRGHVVDIEALKENIDSGKLLGAAVDVFPSEPRSNDDPFESILIGCRNTILTSHIGGSTLEAQENIADFVPTKLAQYVNSGSTLNSVNFPEIQLGKIEGAHRLIHIHRNVPGILANINQVFAKHKCNILGQNLKTNESIGYLITAIDKQYDDEVVQDLKNIPDTIRFRVLY
ncbi:MULTISPECIES: phosphoglycerate dehydrogenase [Persicobacter]|uniref:D-3-phosphoglycerate dehydrogenase n=1 Tax=Persicobacter diffluens TaxID=981 RepID=A0AAN4VYC2_9BACT|nr:phosphoglycerate dehydrogenase [Persicobacter sp. CCB-QB2]GJM61065.1 hypothetical protein PEDI_16170 [Persicobacter diffluens]